MTAVAYPGFPSNCYSDPNYMIVVPVTINGSGPYDFVLDTGSNNTMLVC